MFYRKYKKDLLEIINMYYNHISNNIKLMLMNNTSETLHLILTCVYVICDIVHIFYKILIYGYLLSKK